MLDGLAVAVIPVGAVAVKATDPVKPAIEVKPIVDVPEVPCTIVRLAELVVREKSGVGAVTMAPSSAV